MAVDLLQSGYGYKIYKNWSGSEHMSTVRRMVNKVKKKKCTVLELHCLVDYCGFQVSKVSVKYL